MYLDDEERDLVESIERGEWKSVRNLKAVVILAAAILVASLIVYMGLMHVGDSMQSAGQDIGLKISNKNSIRVELGPVEIADSKTAHGE